VRKKLTTIISLSKNESKSLSNQHIIKHINKKFRKRSYTIHDVDRALRNSFEMFHYHSRTFCCRQPSFVHAQANCTDTSNNNNNGKDPTTCSVSSTPTNSSYESSDDSCYVSLLEHVPTIALHKYVFGNCFCCCKYLSTIFK
jgi:hypothetical protein